MKYHIKSLAAITFTSLLLVSTFLATAQTALADFQKTKIAVLDFELIGDKPDTADMGAILSEWFITSIVKSGRFDVVERAMLQKIIAEQRLSTTGLIDENSASELGKILGVKVIISGSLVKIKNSIEINARVISVESGSIIAAEYIRSNTSSDLQALVYKLTTKIMRNFPLTGYVVKKTPNSVIIDLGLASGLTPGTEFIVYKEGEVIKRPKTGEVLDVEQILTGRIRITKVSRNVAEGTILSEEADGIEYGQLVKSDQKPEVSPIKTPEMAGIQTLQPAKFSPPKNTTQTVIAIKPDRAKKVSQTVKQKPAVHPRKRQYRVAIFPWVLTEEANSFTTILIDRIQHRISDMPKLTLAKSYYHLKRIPSLDQSIRASDLFNWSKPNLAVLRRYGKEQNIDIAIIGKINIHCRWSDNCTVRNMNFTLVDLVTGKVYAKSGLSWNMEAADYIDSITANVLKKYDKAIRLEEKQRIAAARQNKKTVVAVDIKNRTYRTAIFPWILTEEANSFTTILIDRITSKIGDMPKVTLTKSYYYVKGVPPLDKSIRASNLFNGAEPNLAVLRRYGKEQHIDIAITGKINIHCRWSDNCTVRNMNFTLVDLVTGKTYAKSGLSWNMEAADYIDSITAKVLNRYSKSIQ